LERYGFFEMMPFSKWGHRFEGLPMSPSLFTERKVAVVVLADERTLPRRFGPRVRRVLGLLALMALAGCRGESKKEADAAKALPTALHQDFKNLASLPESLVFRNRQNPEHAQLLPGGLLLKVEKPFLIRANTGIGVKTAFALRGDFDIIVAFDQFKADTPVLIPGSGNGVGFTLRVELVDKGVTGINRWVQSGREGVLWAKQASKIDPLGFAVTNMTAGRLRLTRTGSTMSRWWSQEMQGDAFHLLEEFNKGSEDVKSVYFEISSNHQVMSVETRVLDWLIRGQKIDPNNAGSLPDFLPAVEGPKPVRRWLVVALGAVALGAVFLLIVGWRYFQRSRATPDSPTSAAR
jgi:hypothetical protein